MFNFIKQLSSSDFLNISHVNPQRALELLNQRRNINQLKLEQRLDDIQLNDEQIKILNDSLDKLDNLQHLEIVINNRIEKESCRSLFQKLKAIGNLTSFMLTFNQYAVDAQLYQILGDGLSNMSNLKHLFICLGSYSVSGETGAADIGLALQKLVNLESLSLRVIGLRINENCYSLLFKGFQHLNNNLLDLQIKLEWRTKTDYLQNEIGNGLKQLINLQYLQIYAVYDVNMKQSDIGEGISKLLNLRSFHFNLSGRNSFDSSDAIQLGQGLKMLSQITSLVLLFGPENSIMSEGAIALGEGISFLKNLGELKLDIINNVIGYEGMKGLKEGIVQLSNIVNISFTFYENALSNQSAAEIGSILSSQSNLKNCKIANYTNAIDDTGVKQILQGFGRDFTGTKSLQSLDLQIFEQGVFDIVPLFKVLENQLCLKSLTLYLQTESLSSDCFQVIAQSVSCLVSLELCKMKFTSAHLSVSQFIHLVQSFSKLTQINALELKLSLSHQDEEEEYNKLRDCFSSLRNIAKFKLDLSKSQISSYGFRQLAKGLSQLGNLKCFKFNLYSPLILDMHDVIHLFQALSSLHQLNQLDILFQFKNKITTLYQSEFKCLLKLNRLVLRKIV